MYLEKISVLCILTAYVTSLFCMANSTFKQQPFRSNVENTDFFFFLKSLQGILDH